MSGVFISYRRADSGGWSGRLFDHLGMRFGKDLVFHDLDDIELGDDFIEVIRQEIQACEAMLVLIGPFMSIRINGSMLASVFTAITV